MAEFFARYDAVPVLAGPARWDVFVDDWLGASWQPSTADRVALASVARAWSNWVRRTMNLPAAAQAELAACLDELLPLPAASAGPS